MPDAQREDKSSFWQRRVLLGTFSLLVAFGIGFSLSAYGFSAPAFLKDSTALISQTFKDVLGLRSRKEKVFEVDLSPSFSETAAPVHDAASTNKTESVIKRSSEPPLQISNEKLPENNSTNRKTENNANVSFSGDQPILSVSSGSSQDNLAPVSDCSFPFSGTPSRQVIFNEIAWMGSPQKSGETAPAASNNEWMELKNVSQENVDLAGWQILDESEKFNIIFNGGKVSPNGLFLLERSDEDSVPGIAADKIYSGALSNSGMWLKIIDANCNTADEINATSGWPGGDNSVKKTLERDMNVLNWPFDTAHGWHTSESSGGTPKKENSNPVPTAQTISHVSTVKYSIGVSLEGDGTGMVQSSPSGILCGNDCFEEYLNGTSVVLTASSSENSLFSGWSGACSGKSDCKIMVASALSVIAGFKSLLPPPGPAAPPSAPVIGAQHVLVSEIMAGIDSNSGYEFVELYNPTQNAVDLTGWSIKKKTSTGTESTLVSSVRLEGKSIPSGKYFLIARENGYNGSTIADALWPTSYTLAYTSNSVELYDAAGNKIEEINWAEIPAGQSYARQSWESNQFSISVSPTPQNLQSQ